MMLAGLAALLLLPGCGAKNDNPGNTTEQQAAASTEAGTKQENDTAGNEGSTAGTVTEEGTEEATEPATEPATVEKQEVVTPGMVPVTGDQLKDGTYNITVRSSSSMFSIESCTLTVTGGEMYAKMIMGGTGYLYICQGTKEEAEASAGQDYIRFTEEADGKHSFTMKVPALNQAVPCAAFSKKKNVWYDRDLCFEASGIPYDAYTELPFKTLEELGLFDGNFMVEVTLSGGSGRASVQSPAELVIENGKATATIVWNSSKYDFMMVDGVRYDPVNSEGENSTFRIPVIGFDYPLPVEADTTAMSEAHLISYTLTFDSASVRK